MTWRQELGTRWLQIQSDLWCCPVCGAATHAGLREPHISWHDSQGHLAEYSMGETQR